MSSTAKLLAVGYWFWSATIGVIAGFFGAVLACEYGCKSGSPSWLQPWTWGSYYVYPEATIMGALGLVVASAFVGFVFKGQRLAAAASFVIALALLSYPYFGGLTAAGRELFAFGPVLGFAAMLADRRA